MDLSTPPKRVSFLISAFNEEAYLDACLKSCLSQTYPHIEIVVVNDGSTDATHSVLNNYKDDPRVTIIHFEKNQGKVAGFNTAYINAKGDYIALMGADDVCYPERIERSLQAITPTTQFIFSQLDKIDENGQILQKNLSHIDKNTDLKTQLSAEALIEKPKVFGGTLLMHRSIAQSIFPLDPQLTHEDWYIPILASLKTNLGYIAQPLIQYRMHEANSSANSRMPFYKMPYLKWHRLKTRDIFYYQKITQLAESQQLNIDFENLKYKETIGRIIQSEQRFKTLSQLWPNLQKFKHRVKILCYVFPKLCYILFRTRRSVNIFFRRSIIKIKKILITLKNSFSHA